MASSYVSHFLPFRKNMARASPHNITLTAFLFYSGSRRTSQTTCLIGWGHYLHTSRRPGESRLSDECLHEAAIVYPSPLVAVLIHFLLFVRSLLSDVNWS